jgi:hypothetical protein
MVLFVPFTFFGGFIHFVIISMISSIAPICF